MGSTNGPTKELRFKNVTVYSGGQSEHGSLHLTQYHLRFTYTPKLRAQKSAEDSQRTHAVPALTTEKSNATTDSTQSQQGSSKHERPTDRSDQPRVKEIWLPYPMINSCVLRPSNSMAGHVRGQDFRSTAETSSDDEGLFPPVFGTASYERPSTDSARLAPFSSPARPSTPTSNPTDGQSIPETGRQPAIRIRRRDFQMMAFHFHQSSSEASPDESARQAFFTLRSRCCINKIEDLHAFSFTPPRQETATKNPEYDPVKEFARMGIGQQLSADSPGNAWRLSSINHDYSYSATYPSILCVPRTVSDNLLKYGGAFRSRSRIPCLTYLHSNGGSITRSSQPMVGVQNKRNPQDERLVSAIFASHTPCPPLSDESLSLQPAGSEFQVADNGLVSDRTVPGLLKSYSDASLDTAVHRNTAASTKKIYGSSRQNLIADARPKINALANRAGGGGIEDVANYVGSNGVPVQKVFLNIANIHVMRSSLERVVESFGSADYLNMKPNLDALRKSGWLGHIAGLLDGSEMVARVVGLGGSHVLVHCSDGWDRTAQVAALAQVMLDPYYRTLDGFITLIQKDYLSFGHKFRDRDGIEGSEKWFEIENERVAPSPRARLTESDPNSLNAFGSKALSSAKIWFEKGRGSLFRQQDGSRENLTDTVQSPPPNPVIHSPPAAAQSDERSHRISEKEIAPIFHQFLDAIYQLLHQAPNVFEFNERFLRRLYYHTYSCQYGEFLFNSEKERRQHEKNVPSVWTHFLSRRAEFVNPDFVPKVDDPLLFPRRSAGIEREVEVRWWSALFRCADEDMNSPRVTATSAFTNPPSGTPIPDQRAADNIETKDFEPSNNSKEAFTVPKSVSSLNTMRESLTNSVSALAMRIAPDRTEVTAARNRSAPGSIHQVEVEFIDEPKPNAEPTAQIANEHQSQSAETAEAVEQESEHAPSPRHEQVVREILFDLDGDPLGVVSGHVTSRTSTGPSGGGGSGGGGGGGNNSTRGMDFATFAAQNRFQER